MVASPKPSCNHMSVRCTLLECIAKNSTTLFWVWVIFTRLSFRTPLINSLTSFITWPTLDRSSFSPTLWHYQVVYHWKGCMLGSYMCALIDCQQLDLKCIIVSRKISIGTHNILHPIIPCGYSHTTVPSRGIKRSIHRHNNPSWP